MGRCVLYLFFPIQCSRGGRGDELSELAVWVGVRFLMTHPTEYGLHGFGVEESYSALTRGGGGGATVVHRLAVAPEAVVRLLDSVVDVFLEAPVLENLSLEIYTLPFGRTPPRQRCP